MKENASNQVQLQKKHFLKDDARSFRLFKANELLHEQKEGRTPLITSKFYPTSINDEFDSTVKLIDDTKYKNKVKFGKNVLIGENVSFGNNCSIGHNSIIEKNVKIGS